MCPRCPGWIVVTPGTAAGAEGGNFFFFPLHFSNSDDNLLKNIELFDKLSLRFNGRVLFIKDVIGDEICCWSFYGQGRKLAEVCCTSIVYATEKKQTKVGDFGLWLPAGKGWCRPPGAWRVSSRQSQQLCWRGERHLGKGGLARAHPWTQFPLSSSLSNGAEIDFQQQSSSVRLCQ